MVTLSIFNHLLSISQVSWREKTGVAELGCDIYLLAIANNNAILNTA
ncbi:MAG: hypothetical protein HEQ24_20570 [Dolichospermum sp. BR01]|nr:hypothetical protein [Dolichospermum sp. BR01]